MRFVENLLLALLNHLVHLSSCSLHTLTHNPTYFNWDSIQDLLNIMQRVCAPYFVWMCVWMEWLKRQQQLTHFFWQKYCSKNQQFLLEGIFTSLERLSHCNGCVYSWTGEVLVQVIDNKSPNSIKGGSCWMGLYSRKTLLKKVLAALINASCMLRWGIYSVSVHKKEVAILTLTGRYWCILFVEEPHVTCLLRCVEGKTWVTLTFKLLEVNKHVWLAS